MFDFSIVTNWFDGLLRSVMPGWGAILIECVLVALIVLTLYAVFAIALIYMERKVCAFFHGDFCKSLPMCLKCSRKRLSS